MDDGTTKRFFDYVDENQKTYISRLAKAVS